MFLELYKNDSLLGSLYGHTSEHLAPAGNAAIVHLNVGDRVQVKTKETSYRVHLWTDHDGNTFSGVELGSDPLCKYEL